ncbi:hypothetical protein [Haloprofundus salilacus]|uniref:hypothetical protein n=1 Tax=Haloprofundus salilacus TaxID=2876190 RepID=UPI001CCDA675|nr:hypothetical protein [Haloprofundus salilacus]
MTTVTSGDSAKIPGYGLKLIVSFWAIGVSLAIGLMLANFFENYSSGLSISAIQVLEAVEFFPLLLAWGFMIRYSAQWLMHIPRLASDTVTQYEKSTVRGVFSLFIATFGLIWWAERLLTRELLAHAIFTWPFPITVLGLSYSSWYYSKMKAYRRAVSEGQPTPSRTESKLPTPIGFLTSVKEGEVTVEKVGLDRGLPTFLFKIESDNGDDIVLNLGMERLLPTALFKQDK